MRLIGIMARGCFLVGTLFCFDKLTLVKEVVKTMISKKLNRLVTSSMRSRAIRVGKCYCRVAGYQNRGTKDIHLGDLPHVNDDRPDQDPHLR